MRPSATASAPSDTSVPALSPVTIVTPWTINGRFIRDTLSLSGRGGPRYCTSPTGGVDMVRVIRASAVVAVLGLAGWLAVSLGEAQTPAAKPAAAKTGGVLRIA